MRTFLVVVLSCSFPLLAAAQSQDLTGISFQTIRSLPAPASVAGTPLPSGNLAKGMAFHYTSISNLGADASLFSLKEYQLGDEWGKKPVTAGSVAKESAVFQRAAKATARYGGGTSFYLGVYNGHHLMATNHHVAEHMGCRARAEFVLLGKSFPCEKIYGDWREIDLVIFSIKVPQAEAGSLAGLGRDFAFDASIYPGQELLTIGFGIAGNPDRSLMANQDSDCKVFSQRNEFLQMADPDDFNPGPDKVWSFANGCDVSHGDSGSSYVDRKTGEVLGIVWTGRIPKSPQVASSKYLDGLLTTNGPEIWTELTYTVPAASIKQVLLQTLADGSKTGEEAATIRAVVEAP